MHLYLSVGQTNHQQRMSDIHGVDTLGQLLGVHRIGRAQIPVPDGFVPAACYEHVIHILHGEQVPDRRVVLCHNLALVRLQVPHFCDIVTAT